MSPDGRIGQYLSIRQELLAIIQARYAVLAFNIAAAGALAAVTASRQDLSVRFTAWLPAIFGAVLVPSLIMTQLMTAHFKRLTALLVEAFEGSPELFPLERAFLAYRMKDRTYAAYTKPIVLMYAFVAGVAVTASVLANLHVVGWNAVVFFPALIVTVILGILFGYRTWTADREVGKYRTTWQEVLREQPCVAPPRSRAPNSAAVFLDRDGTINENRPGDVTTLDAFEFIPNAIAGIVRLSKAGLPPIIVTNQPGIDEDRISRSTLELIHRKMTEAIESAGGELRAIYYCPHARAGGCDCRKPRTGLFRRAATDFHVDLARSYVVGDQVADIRAAVEVGAFSILVRTGGR